MQPTSFQKLGEKGDVDSKAQLFDEEYVYVNFRKQNPEQIPTYQQPF